MKKFYQEIDKKFVQEFKKKVLASKSIVLASHIAPDDDSISSILSIHYYLTEVLKIDEAKIRILYTWEKTETWNYFKRFSEVNFVDDIFNHIKDNDLIIFADGSGWRRFSRKDQSKALKNYVICIDHHIKPEDRFDLHLVTPQYLSTAEVIYRLFFEVEKLKKEICEILLMGILGDTGNFKYVKPEQASVFGIAQRLVSEGEIIVEELQSKYQYLTLEVYKTLQELMKNSMIKKVEGWPDMLISYITPEFIDENKLNDNQISEASGMFTPYLKTIKDISWGIVFTPRNVDETCKLSLRSVPKSVSVRDIMERMKCGGGHDRAAGGSLNVKDPKVAIKTVLDWMSQNQPVIN